MNQPIDLSFIVCAFNEEKNIKRALSDVLKSCEKRSETFEILVLDNGSTDGTREILEDLKHPQIRTHFNARNLGKGGSIRRGIAVARGTHFVIFDPDGEYRVKDAWTAYDLIKASGATGALASRVLNRKIKTKYVANYLGVRGLSILTNFLYGTRLTDVATATKLFDRNFVNQIEFRCTGFDFDFELITKVALRKGKILEVSADYFPRTVAEGKKIKAIRDGLKAFKIILADSYLNIGFRKSYELAPT